LFAFLVNRFTVKEMMMTEMQHLKGSKKFRSIPFHSWVLAI